MEQYLMSQIHIILGCLFYKTYDKTLSKYMFSCMHFEDSRASKGVNRSNPEEITKLGTKYL